MKTTKQTTEEVEFDDESMSEQACYTCGRRLSVMEVACGDGNCVDCFEL